MSNLFSRLRKHLLGGDPKRTQPTRNRPTRRLELEHLEERRLLSGSPLAADADRSLTTPTAAWFYSGVNANFLTSHIQANSSRITGLTADPSNPGLFSATLVKNTGAYAHSWWWYYGQTAAQVTTQINAHQARIEDISAYQVGGQTRFAVVMVSNTGAAAKNWWWYTGQSQAQVTAHINANQGRLVDLDSRLVNGTRVYDCVMVKNTGADARAWWWYVNSSPAQVSSQLNTNHARLIDIAPNSNGRYNVVMVQNTAPSSDPWHWYYGQTLSGVLDKANRNGDRVVDIEKYTESGQTRFAAVMINNSNEVTTRVGNLLRAASSSANVGTYLKQLDGPVLARLESGRQFEPASMIKALLLLHTMRQVKAGNVHLTDQVSFYYKPGDNIANLTKGNKDVNPDSYAETPANRITESLGMVLERMMEVSDNRATRAIDKLFGRPAILATAALAGMTSTAFASTLGSGIPGNFLTLQDASKLYEKVADGTLLGTGSFRDEFFRRMTDWKTSDTEQVPFGEGVFGAFKTVALEEAARKLNTTTGSSAAVNLANAFVAQMRGVWKGGGYTTGFDANNWFKTSTVGGWVELPFKQAGVLKPRGYTYGLFLEHGIVPKVPASNSAVTAINTAWTNGQGELLRMEIRAALATW